MSADTTLNDLRVLTTAGASDLLTVSIPVMERWRREGTGPRFIRLSTRRVGYRVADLRAWMADRSEGGQRLQGGAECGGVQAAHGAPSRGSE